MDQRASAATLQGQGSYLIVFYHVSEYLSAAGTAIAGQKARGWLEKQQSLLKDNRVEEVIEQLLPHIESAEITDVESQVRRCHQYLTKHRQQMNYKEPMVAGLPIGSGEQEKRKKSGVWSKRENSGEMLALRINRANGEWRTYWRQQRQAAS